ncbi:MAG TPA: HK97 gp10 family phage protein [Spirochaetia bacterium]|nr:HK97 gp10 family phage protein [Spirochaetia bacterium]
MAKFDFEIPADFIKQLGKLADVDRIAPQMIDEAIPKLLDNVKKETAGHKQTGDMYKSIKATKAKKNKYGYYASVTPTGADKKGVRNMEKMVYLEYGTSKQSPAPTLTKAIKDSEKAVLDKMQEVFNREVGG